jgi:hypothetical protein
MKAIAAHLSDAVPPLRLAGTAADFIRAQQDLTATPAAFVLPARETAQRNPFASQAVEQDVASEFAVMIAALDLSDATGAATLESLEPIREQIRSALLNWQPDTDHAGCEYVDGEMFQLDANGVLWWADRYRSGFQIRSTQ